MLDARSPVRYAPLIRHWWLPLLHILTRYSRQLISLRMLLRLVCLVRRRDLLMLDLRP